MNGQFFIQNKCVNGIKACCDYDCNNHCNNQKTPCKQALGESGKEKLF